MRMSTKKQKEVLILPDNISNPLPRMRTLVPACELLKECDSQTAITKHWVRSLVLEGKVPSVMVGRKRLIDVDALIRYINECGTTATTEPAQGQIRRIQP